MNFLALTLPASILLAAVLLALVLRAARDGHFDDWEGPAYRHHFDDDRYPERDTAPGEPHAPPLPGPDLD
jgi:cbb3-type cytochrome oxidase maturation protein